jgi:hypothetical protein
MSNFNSVQEAARKRAATLINSEQLPNRSWRFAGRCPDGL